MDTALLASRIRSISDLRHAAPISRLPLAGARRTHTAAQIQAPTASANLLLLRRGTDGRARSLSSSAAGRGRGRFSSAQNNARVSSSSSLYATPTAPPLLFSLWLLYRLGLPYFFK